jgi:murein L,D-transpeptidase YafK
MNFSKVKTAYKEKEKDVINNLKKHNIQIDKLEIYLQAFKSEKVLELWAKSKGDKVYTLVREFAICTSSGTLGPKRMEGDMQVPEGFYYLSHFNPESNFYLSLGINYPNESDKILANKKHPGGAIYIHGNCVTIGCIPITDELIKELYIYAVEAKNNGQEKIPVNIFPCKLNDKNYKYLHKTYADNPSYLEFWGNLKPCFDFFENHKYLPGIKVLKNGKYSIQ